MWLLNPKKCLSPTTNVAMDTYTIRVQLSAQVPRVKLVTARWTRRHVAPRQPCAVVLLVRRVKASKMGPVVYHVQHKYAMLLMKIHAVTPVNRVLHTVLVTNVINVVVFTEITVMKEHFRSQRVLLHVVIATLESTQLAITLHAPVRVTTSAESSQ